jgi:hypothetical protein
MYTKKNECWNTCTEIEDEYAIQDDEGNYVDKNSLYEDEKGRLQYAPCKSLLNGCYYFGSIETATLHLRQLEHMNKLHKKKYRFKISKIK